MGERTRTTDERMLDFVMPALAEEFPELTVADRLDVLAITPAAAARNERKLQASPDAALEREARMHCWMEAMRNAARATLQRRDPFAFAASES